MSELKATVAELRGLISKISQASRDGLPGRVYTLRARIADAMFSSRGEALLAAAEAVERVGWHRTADELPEDGDWSLTYDGRFVEMSRFHPNGHWIHARTNLEASRQITHWRPLPEPPTEARDTNEAAG